MGTEQVSNLLTTKLPQQWACVPEPLSISTLLTIESCPRRWALSNSGYPDIWGQRGYPEKPSTPMLKGRIIHKVLETIIKNFVKRGCNSLDDPRAIEIMRECGGYSAIISDVTQQVLALYDTNPRAHHIIGHISQKLLAAAPELRSKVQTLLIQSGFQISSLIKNKKAQLTIKKQQALGNGVYTEIELLDEMKKWKGIVDLLILSPEDCEIRDYKSGQEKEDDHFQLNVYAWLWFQDVKRNPTKRLATKLTIIYTSGAVFVDAPSVEEMNQFQLRLNNRAAQAIAAITEIPPFAIPEPEKCMNCTVRHLCEEYWVQIREFTSREGGVHQFFDLQMRIINRRGPRTWDAEIEFSESNVISGSVIVVSTGAYNIQKNFIIRLTEALITWPEENDVTSEDVPLVIISRNSELFLIT